jgi:N-carbamoyl-L-amino-acid hydrolase
VDERKNQLAIDGDRLWRTLMRSGEIGTVRETGLCRLALTDEDKTMRDQFVEWCRDADLSVSVDGVGNIFARRSATDDSLPPVMIGSHLDSQILGGKYDGILGVLAGLEIVRTLDHNGIETKRPIELVSWTNEEGTRYPPPMMGSGAFAGVHDVDWVLARGDETGATFGDELSRIGYAGDAAVGGRDIDSYLELHIEQGPILDADGIDVGIVVDTYRAHGIIVEIRGETAHTAPTPMDQRRNALYGAALLITRANDIANDHAPDAKAATPVLESWPNKWGIIHEYAALTVDFRHPDPEVADGMVAEFRSSFAAIADQANVSIEIVDNWQFGDQPLDDDCVTALKVACDDLGIIRRDMLSQAGHDAYHMARVCPTALVFSPCVDGITHNVAEDIELDRTTASVNVLMHAALARANR